MDRGEWRLDLCAWALATVSLAVIAAVVLYDLLTTGTAVFRFHGARGYADGNLGRVLVGILIAAAGFTGFQTLQLWRRGP